MNYKTTLNNIVAEPQPPGAFFLAGAEKPNFDFALFQAM